MERCRSRDRAARPDRRGRCALRPRTDRRAGLRSSAGASASTWPSLRRRRTVGQSPDGRADRASRSVVALEQGLNPGVEGLGVVGDAVEEGECLVQARRVRLGRCSDGR